MERESAPIRAARRAFGATDDDARASARDGARARGRGPTPKPKAELARGGALASARSATLALASLCAIAVVSARLDAASRGARASAVVVGTTTRTTATATATLREDEAVEPELRVGDRSVAYVAKGWNAERRLIGDDKIEAIWEGPAAENAAGEFEATKPKGALLALHGCHHSAKDFFATNTKCSQCRGLAQEMAITRTALNRGYVVLAISSLGTCWSKDIDAPRVQAVLDVFYNDTALSDLPLFAFGASSGGSFVGAMPQMQLTPKAAGLIIQIAPGPTASGVVGEVLADYPPTVFSHMPRDARTAEFIAASIADFRNAGVRIIESRLEPRAIDDAYFYEQSFGRVSEEESAAMVASLRSFNLIDAQGLLTEDPRLFDDDHIIMIKRHAPEWDSLLADQSDTRELLNVAYAMHELSAQDFSKNFAWLVRSHAHVARSTS